MRKKFNAGCVKVGEDLPWDLVNKTGKILFKNGFSVHNDAALKRLLSLELYYSDGPSPSQSNDADDNQASPGSESESPFTRLDLLTDRLMHQFDAIVREPAHCLDRLEALIADVRHLYSQHPSACIAAVHFRHDKSHACLHPLYSLFIVELLAGPLGYEQATHRALSAAAMTANLGMYEFHNQWCNQKERLDETQVRQLRAHPQRSVERLRACGVTDDLWLKMVAHHHERNDGSGYPKGLSRGELQSESLVISLIDRYLSFIMPRTYRKIQHPTSALKIIYEDAAAHDEQLVSTLIKRLGVYPPGTLVKLANGEIAVVTQHDLSRPTHPHVASVGHSANSYLHEPVTRDTCDDQYNVQALYHYDADVEPIHPATRVMSWT